MSDKVWSTYVENSLGIKEEFSFEQNVEGILKTEILYSR